MLKDLDLSARIEDHDDYKRQRAAWPLRLLHLEQTLAESKRAVVLAYEGWKAAGKGECIRRVTETLDPRGPISGAMRSGCPSAAPWLSSIAPGMGACWSSVLRASRRPLRRFAAELSPQGG